MCIYAIFGRISEYRAERLPPGGQAGRCQVDGSKWQWVNQRIVELESRVHPLFHSNLFVPNFMTKFGSEDFQSQGRVRPPPSETVFSRSCGHPNINCWASCFNLIWKRISGGGVENVQFIVSLTKYWENVFHNHYYFIVRTGYEHKLVVI
jgi:hypothetical protein